MTRPGDAALAGRAEGARRKTLRQKDRFPTLLWKVKGDTEEAISAQALRIFQVVEQRHEHITQLESCMFVCVFFCE